MANEHLKIDCPLVKIWLKYKLHGQGKFKIDCHLAKIWLKYKLHGQGTFKYCSSEGSIYQRYIDCHSEKFEIEYYFKLVKSTHERIKFVTKV